MTSITITEWDDEYFQQKQEAELRLLEAEEVWLWYWDAEAEEYISRKMNQEDA